MSPRHRPKLTPMSASGTIAVGARRISARGSLAAIALPRIGTSASQTMKRLAAS